MEHKSYDVTGNFQVKEHNAQCMDNANKAIDRLLESIDNAVLALSNASIMVVDNTELSNEIRSKVDQLLKINIRYVR